MAPFVLSKATRMPDPRPAADPVSTLALAHELRTPLTALALGLGLLEEGVLGPLPEGQREVVHTLVGEVARLTLLVQRYVDTGRLGAYAGPVERIHVDLCDLVRRAAAPIERQARERGVCLALALPDGIVVVADPVKLSWVVVSLMGNALRYSPAGAEVEVGLALVAGEAELLGPRSRPRARGGGHGQDLRPGRRPGALSGARDRGGPRGAHRGQLHAWQRIHVRGDAARGGAARDRRARRAGG